MLSDVAALDLAREQTAATCALHGLPYRTKPSCAAHSSQGRGSGASLGPTAHTASCSSVHTCSCTPAWLDISHQTVQEDRLHQAEDALCSAVHALQCACTMKTAQLPAMPLLFVLCVARRTFAHAHISRSEPASLRMEAAHLVQVMREHTGLQPVLGVIDPAQCQHVGQDIR